jgi:hypothetical protein
MLLRGGLEHRQGSAKRPSAGTRVLDGFTGLFYRAAWEVIKDDVLAVVKAIWSLDSRSFHLLNDALMILLPKTLLGRR